MTLGSERVHLDTCASIRGKLRTETDPAPLGNVEMSCRRFFSVVSINTPVKKVFAINLFNLIYVRGAGLGFYKQPLALDLRLVKRLFLYPPVLVATAVTGAAAAIAAVAVSCAMIAFNLTISVACNKDSKR